MPLLATITAGLGLFKAGKSIWYKVKKPVPREQVLTQTPISTGAYNFTPQNTPNNNIIYIVVVAILVIFGITYIKK
jgi:hypothetical protein